MIISDFIKLFPTLNKRTIKLSALDVSSRVFFNWKDKGVIDYKHTYNKVDLEKKVNRKAILLNVFEALWILIVLELRTLNISLEALIELKVFLFSSIEADLNAEELKHLDNDSLKTLIPEEVITGLDISIEDLLKKIKNNESYNESIYYSNIAGLINAILINGHSPSIMIYKEPSIENNNFYIFNPHAERFYYNTLKQDYRDVIINKLAEFSIINIPIKPLLSKFFEKDALNTYATTLGLYTDNEIALFNIIKDKKYDKIIIKNNKDKEDISFEVSSFESIQGDKAVALRKLIGLKDYQKVEVTYRNEKHVFINKIIKYRPKQKP
jgi:hypothetical protein